MPSIRLRLVDIGGPPPKKQRTDDHTDEDNSPTTTTIFEELSSNSSHSSSDCTSVIKNNNSNNEDVVVGDDEGRMGGMIVSSSSLSSSTSTSEAMMVNEIDEYDDETTVKSILTNYLQNIDEIYTNVEERAVVLKEGLDKLYRFVGEKNTNNIIKQQHRVEMLELGGHWLLTDLLRTFLGNNNGNGNETNVVDVVIRACEILHELLLTDPNTAIVPTSTSTTSKVKYQVYCAGGLDMILSALNKFPSNYHVQLTGCKFISCLISCSSSSSSSSSSSFDNNNFDDDVMFFDNNHFDDDFMDDDENENDAPYAHYGGNNLTGVIDDLYRSTDGLDVIVRLVGGYNFVDGGAAANMPSSMNNTNNNGSLRTVQIWGLFFNATSVIQKVLQQSDPNSNRRSEIIKKVKEHSYTIHHRSNSNNEGDDAMIDDDIDINNGELVEDFHSSWGGYGSGKGLAKHMYDHIMSILIDEDDYNDADANRGEQYMRL